jgi:hypothetical protein
MCPVRSKHNTGVFFLKKYFAYNFLPALIPFGLLSVVLVTFGDGVLTSSERSEFLGSAFSAESVESSTFAVPKLSLVWEALQSVIWVAQSLSKATTC